MYADFMEIMEIMEKNNMGKSKTNKFIKIFCFLTVLILVMASCTVKFTPKEEKEWEAIKDTGTIEVFLDFAAGLTDGKILDEANLKIKEKLNAEENPEKLDYLLNQYPGREDDFKNRISEIAFNSALKENTAAALRDYIDGFADYCKNAEFIDEARIALKNMTFNEAKEQKSIALLEEFIGRYKEEDAAMSEEAESVIDDINWESAQKTGARKDYENYVINAIWNKLNDPELKPVSQQYIQKPDGGHYFIDLYFPQLHIGVEIDEAHHLFAENQKSDKERTATIFDVIRQVTLKESEILRVSVVHKDKNGKIKLRSLEDVDNCIDKVV